MKNFRYSVLAVLVICFTVLASPLISANKASALEFHGQEMSRMLESGGAGAGGFGANGAGGAGNPGIAPRADDGGDFFGIMPQGDPNASGPMGTDGTTPGNTPGNTADNGTTPGNPDGTATKPSTGNSGTNGKPNDNNQGNTNTNPTKTNNNAGNDIKDDVEDMTGKDGMNWFAVVCWIIIGVVIIALIIFFVVKKKKD